MGSPLQLDWKTCGGRRGVGVGVGGGPQGDGTGAGRRAGTTQPPERPRGGDEPASQHAPGAEHISPFPKTQCSLEMVSSTHMLGVDICFMDQHTVCFSGCCIYTWKGGVPTVSFLGTSVFHCGIQISCRVTVFSPLFYSLPREVS